MTALVEQDEPVWQRDRLKPAPEALSRRNFIHSAGAYAVLALLTNACGTENPVDGGGSDGDGITVSGNTVRLDLRVPGPDILSSTGGFLFIRSARTVAINVGAGQIRAFTSICTHQQCDIDAFRNNRFACPCHGSEFDTAGNAVRGPATAPLQEYTVARSGDTVTITR